MSSCVLPLQVMRAADANIEVCGGTFVQMQSNAGANEEASTPALAIRFGMSACLATRKDVRSMFACGNPCFMLFPLLHSCVQVPEIIGQDAHSDQRKFNRTKLPCYGHSRTVHTPLINALLIIHHSSYTTHHTPLIIHHSSYTTHHTPLINTPLINTPLIIHHSSYTTHHTPLIIHHSSYTTHHPVSSSFKSSSSS